ncbi:MAG: septum formation initiator family protein [bacterium]
MKRIASNITAGLVRFVTPVRLVVVVAVAAFFWFLIAGDQGIAQFRRLMDMKHRLLAERTALNEKIDKLTREREILSNPDNLETIIRKELGYIRPGEVLFEEKTSNSKSP